jgi:hypothetical protein
MKNSKVWELLEAKRAELKETIVDFAPRVNMRPSAYCGCRKRKIITKKMSSAVMAFLNLTENEMMSMRSPEEMSPIALSEQEVSADELEWLAGAMKALKLQRTPIQKVLQLLKFK